MGLVSLFVCFLNFCHAEMLLKIKGKQDLKQKKNNNKTAYIP